MLVWIFNILDLIIAMNLIALQFGYLKGLAVFSIIYLVIKGIIFIKDPFSIIDIFIAAYIILLLIGITTFFTWIFVLYLLYKTIISFQV